MTGNKNELENGREIQVGGSKKIGNSSPSWPSSLDIGSWKNSLYKGIKTDILSDEDYFPLIQKIGKLMEIKNTIMDLGKNKAAEKTGIRDSKHAKTKEISATPEKTKEQEIRFKRAQVVELNKHTWIPDTLITQPSTVPKLYLKQLRN